MSVWLCAGRDDDFERTKKTDFKGEYQGIKEEPVVSRLLTSLVNGWLSYDVASERPAGCPTSRW